MLLSSISLSFRRLDRGPTAIIIVGKEEVHFCMPMGLIFHYSAMADKTLNIGFSESGSNIIRLPEHEPDTFAIFKAWIYQGDIRVQEFCQGPEECPETRSLETLVNTCLQLCKLYILVDYLESRYRDDMSEEILVELRGVVCKTEYYQTVTPFLPEIALYVFRNTSAKSGLRAFIVENLDKTFWHKKKPHVNEYEKCIVEFPLEFAAQLIKSVINSSKMAGDAGME